jgi:hypothetical protein
MHDYLGVTWPCEEIDGFKEIWSDLQQSIDSLGHGKDADYNFALATWCVATHLAPLQVVETGVGRGITTRFLLESLKRHGRGHLWSIDLPPLRDAWVGDVARAVPKALSEGRWTYVRGASSRRLVPLLKRIGSIDLFIHDGLHTRPNMRFEFEAAWPRVRPGGMLLADDVSNNDSFASLVGSEAAVRSLVAQQEEKQGLHGGGGFFGLARKEEGTRKERDERNA